MTQTIKYSDLIKTLLNSLEAREREVLIKRNCLDGQAKKATLQQIGRDYKVTRERVRQIETEALKRLTDVLESEQYTSLKETMDMVDQLMARHGGFIAQNHLMQHLLRTDNPVEANALVFILENILDSKYSQFQKKNYDLVWKKETLSDEQLHVLAEAINGIIEKNDKPMNFEEIMDNAKSHQIYQQINSIPAENHDIVEALLRARVDLKKNILNQWGKAHWTTITPKRMTDKAYLVLIKEGKPLHFEEVANKINEANFDRKKACAATVHNELIMDDKYVLVGRGLYALKEWGYESGTVGDLITKLLKERGPMTKDELTEEILKQRMVQKTTVMLALMNKQKFNKQENGKFQVAK